VVGGALSGRPRGRLVFSQKVLFYPLFMCTVKLHSTKREDRNEANNQRIREITQKKRGA
jgi:hypothetical protein